MASVSTNLEADKLAGRTPLNAGYQSGKNSGLTFGDYH